MDKNAYLQLLAPIVADYRKREYSFWQAYLSGEVIVIDVAAPDGSHCCVEINAAWDDQPNGDVRVIASISNEGWRAFVPVTDSFIIAADGTSVGDP